MKKYPLTLLTLFVFCLAFAQYGKSASNDKQIDYIIKHAQMAVEEMKLYKVPASITLAQGILESASGTSELALNANNHFGIKCKGKEWSGRTYYKSSPEDNGRRVVNQTSCFRAYDSVEEGYRDHSKFLALRPYYTSCFDLEITDYKGFARCLKSSGYATDRNYAHSLINRIETHKLHEFDKIEPHEVPEKLKELYQVNIEQEAPKEVEVLDVKKEKLAPEITTTPPVTPTKTIEVPKRKKNPRTRIKRHPIGREYIVVEKGETLSELSKVYKVSVDKLMRYNELPNASKLIAGQNLFFGKKKNKAKIKTHTVKKGETLYLISQKHGIKLKKLLKRNRLKTLKITLQPGEKIYLRGKKPKR